MINANPVLERVQPSVKIPNKAVPIKKTMRRPIMSAIEPARRSEQPDVSLFVKVRDQVCTYEM
jgi:hypothetical protein